VKFATHTHTHFDARSDVKMECKAFASSIFTHSAITIDFKGFLTSFFVINPLLSGVFDI
jgi:hypothetical protein